MSQNSRKGAVEAGGGLALAGNAVGRDARTSGADNDERVGDDPLHIFLGHRAHQDAGGAAIGDDHIAGHVKRVLTSLARELVDRFAGLGGRRVGDADVRPGFAPAEIRKAVFWRMRARMKGSARRASIASIRSATLHRAWRSYQERPSLRRHPAL